jgi:hypothetical protein
MGKLPSSIEKAILEAHLPRHASQKIIEVLEGSREEIPFYRATRFIRLLDNLKSERFTNLAKIEKRELLGNFFDLVNYGHEKTVGQICHLFFEARLPFENDALLLPPQMTAALVMAGISERFDAIKEAIWSFLIRRIAHLEKLVSPDELIFGLWANAPIIRNSIIQFLFRNYKPDAVVEAAIRHVSKTGKTIPTFAARRIIEFAREETESKQTEKVLTEILGTSNLSVEEKIRVWSDYLKSRTRFELVRISSSCSCEANWIESFMEDHLQLSFNFSRQKNTSYRTPSFRNRITAIKELHSS